MLSRMFRTIWSMLQCPTLRCICCLILERATFGLESKNVQYSSARFHAAIYAEACAAAGDEGVNNPLFTTPDEGFGMETNDDGVKMKIKKIHKQMFDAIQFKRAEAQFKRATEILAVDPKDYRALSYVATRSCKQVNAIMSSAPTQRTKYGIGQFRDVVQYRFGVPMTLLRQAYSLRINTRENKATGNRGILPTCDLEGHELLNLVDAPNKRGRLYRRHEAWQNVIAWFLTLVGIGITGSPFGTPPTCKGTFRMAAAQATGWHTMSASEAETFRRENYII